MQIQRFNDQRILQLACRKIGFSVSWRWRDDSIRLQCTRLMNNGMLRRTYSRGRDDYEITPKGKEHLKALQVARNE